MIGQCNINRDERGSAGFEVALAIPILVCLMIGILQVAMVLQANGAMRNALGEGLRLAKVDPTASETDVLSRTRGALVGVAPSAVDSLTFERAVQNNADTGQITMTIQLRPVIPFAAIPSIELTQSKKIYLPT